MTIKRLIWKIRMVGFNAGAVDQRQGNPTQGVLTWKDGTFSIEVALPLHLHSLTIYPFEFG